MKTTIARKILIMLFAAVLAFGYYGWRVREDAHSQKQVKLVRMLISDADRICELHYTKLAKTIAPVIYGEIEISKFDLDLDKARRHSFPHAKYDVIGGCVIDLATPLKAVILVCSQCQEARQKWESAYYEKQ